MGLFSRKSPPLVGVDISSTAIKLLELSRVGRGGKSYRVESYAAEPLPEGLVVDKAITDVEAVGEAMQRLIHSAKPKTNLAAVAVGGSAVITKVIQMQSGQSEEELEESVNLEADQYIPYAMEDVMMDFTVIGPNEKNPEEEVDVMLAASKSDNVDNRIAVLEMGNLTPKVVDIELFALENAFTLMAQNDPEIDSEDTIALVDVGATTMTFSVLRNLSIDYTREHNFGGNQLTEQMQHRFGLSYKEAVNAKRQGSSAFEDRSIYETYESELLEPFKEAMAQEISRALQFYYSSSTAGTIGHIVLAGGCASIPGIVELVHEKIGGHVTIANPFASMSVASNVKKKALMNDAPGLMIACGLALRSFD